MKQAFISIGSGLAIIIFSIVATRCPQLPPAVEPTVIETPCES